MIKSDLTQAISQQFTDLSEYHVSECVNDLIAVMIAQLIKKERIEIRGFGTFDVHYRAPRQARNPKTGEKIAAPAKYILRFKAGKALRDHGL